MSINNRILTESPTPEIQLNHLYPRKTPEVMIGHWETGKKYLVMKGKEKEAFIIDELGEFVWNLCNGENSVRTIDCFVANNIRL